MIERTTRLKWRRRFRRSKRQVEDIGVQAEEHLERHLIRRLSRLFDVRRFVLGWLLLLTLLCGLVVVQIRGLSAFYQELKPVPGGTYTEGVIGTFSNANPIYALGGVDGSVSRLVFSGLLKYDEQNKLIGDLAESWSRDKTDKRYTVKLKNDLFWHDGQRLTAEDVVFTYDLIQNPDTKSPLFTSWQGVKVTAKDELTVTFELPNILTAFPYSLTNGIVPKHLLESIPAEQLRSAHFNTAEPIGSGPYVWDTVEVQGGTPEEREERIGLMQYERYHFGTPKIQRFIMRTFRDEDRLLSSIEKRELNGVVGLNRLPNSMKDNLNIQSYSIPLTGAVMVFFRTNQEVLKDVLIRQALVRAVDTKELINSLGYPAIPVTSPFLRNQIGYNRKLSQLEHDIKEANLLLDKAGWKKNTEGIREKNKQKLSFRLHAMATSEFTDVTYFLQNSWRELGVQVEVLQPDDSEFQSIVSLHNFDSVLYGISLGADPDVFAYWHSSQANVLSPSRLNLSQYKSAQADHALESGRTRTDPKLRIIKYRPFLAAWRHDAPALALYQPRFLYVVRGGLFNFDSDSMNTAADRFNNVHNWMIRQAKQNKE